MGDSTLCHTLNLIYLNYRKSVENLNFKDTFIQMLRKSIFSWLCFMDYLPLASFLYGAWGFMVYILQCIFVIQLKYVNNQWNVCYYNLLPTIRIKCKSIFLFNWKIIKNKDFFFKTKLNNHNWFVVSVPIFNHIILFMF